MTEIYEVALSDNGITYSPFVRFEPGDVRDLAKFVKFRVTVFGDFAEDDYRLRGFSGIADDATLQEGGFGISPFGRFPFGDGGICLESTPENFTTSLTGSMLMGGDLQVVYDAPLSGAMGLSGDLAIFVSTAESGSMAMSGDLQILVKHTEAGALLLSGALAATPLLSETGSMSMSGALSNLVKPQESGSLSMSGSLSIVVFAAESGSMAMTGAVVTETGAFEAGSMAMSGNLVVTPLTGTGAIISGTEATPSFSTTNIYLVMGTTTNASTATLGAAQTVSPITMTIFTAMIKVNTPAPQATTQHFSVRVNKAGTTGTSVQPSIGIPAPPTVAQVATASGNLTNGSYTYRVAYVINGQVNRESNASASVTVDATHKQVSVSAIAVGPAGTTARKLYRAASAASSTWRLVTTINDNSTTTFTDNVADPAVGTENPINTPGTPVAALAGLGAGNVNSGTHSYRITFVTTEAHGGQIEWQRGAPSNVITTSAGNGQVNVTGIETGPSNTVARKLYRTVAGDAGGHLLVTTISDNVTTSFLDNIADGSLGAAAPTVAPTYSFFKGNGAEPVTAGDLICHEAVVTGTQSLTIQSIGLGYVSGP